MKETILIYLNSLQPSGGIERVIATLSNKLSDKYEVTILVKDESISFYKLNEYIKLMSLNNALVLNMDHQLSRMISISMSFVKTYKLLKAFLRKNSFDHYYVAHPLNALEFHLARGIDKQTIVAEHGSQTAYNVVYRKIKKWLYPRARIYVVPTKTDTTLYENMGLPAIYIPHFRSELDYVKAERIGKTVLTVGRFTAVKQQMLLLSAWNDIVKDKPELDWKLQIVGKGELQTVMESYITLNHLQNRVQILPPTKEIDVYYKNASFFVLTSSSEGFGMVLLEAISFGLPCVSFDCPSGPRDVIKNNVNGMLIEQNNLTEFKIAMLKLMQDTESLRLMGDRAYRDSFDWTDEKVIDKWHSILTK